jgi:hypothetical protein
MLSWSSSLGTVAGEMVFFVNLVLPIYKIKDQKYFWFWKKNRRDMLNFMSFGVLGEYGKIVLAFSPYALKYFLRILRIKLKYFPRIQGGFCALQTTLTLSDCSCMSKYFPCIF